MKKFKKNISLILLVAFVCSKLIGFHSLLHNDQESFKNCNICEFVIPLQNTPCINTSYDFNLPVNNLVYFYNPCKIHINKNVNFNTDFFKKSIQSRPPPTTIT